MKKGIALLLVLVLCFGLCACQRADINSGSTTEATPLESTGTIESSEEPSDTAEAVTQATELPTEKPTEALVREITYILNTNSKKYHDPNCSSARKIAEKNREETTFSKAELEAMGYKPCGICKP